MFFLSKVINLNYQTKYFIMQRYQYLNLYKILIIKQVKIKQNSLEQTQIFSQVGYFSAIYRQYQFKLQTSKLIHHPYQNFQYTSTNLLIEFPQLPLQTPTTPLHHFPPSKNPQTIPYLPRSYSNTPIPNYLTKTTSKLQIMNLSSQSEEDGLQISSWMNDFYNIQKKKIPTPMIQTVPIKSFDSEIIYDSEEQVQVKRLEDQFLDQVLEKDIDQDSETRIKREFRTRPIAKKEHHYVERVQSYRISLAQERKKRNNSKSGKWSGANRNNYYKAILKFYTENPYYTVSWRFWKPEKFYPKMIEQINKNEIDYKKDVIQTKSFDQRQRKEFFDKEPKLDMIELALMRVKDMQCIDFEATEILRNYEERLKQKSEHMRMLEEMMMKGNEKKYEFEDLYVKITGAARMEVEDCANSVFYS